MSSIARRAILAPLGYERTRMLLAGAGTTLLVILAAVMAVRGVDRIEIIAALLYVPLFLAVMTTGVGGGIVAGIVAAAIYIGMRYSAIDIVGTDRVIGLIAFRASAYIAFGAIGGWAARHLETPLRKLEDHDLIDDATELFNAGYFLRQTDLEKARADRYGTPFSVVTFSIPSASLSVKRIKHDEDPVRGVADLARDRIRMVAGPSMRIRVKSISSR